MGVLSNMIKREELNPGDHIYSWRAGYIYAHHGIYVGDDLVIHFARGNGQETGAGTFLDRFLFSSSPSKAGNLCEKCGDQSQVHGVISSCIDCFLAGGNLYLFHYLVSPVFFIVKARGGTCTRAAPDETDTVLHRAKFLLNNGFGTYSIFKNNSEDFAIYCKTGLQIKPSFSVGRSGQLGSFIAAFSAIVSSPLPLLTTNPAGLMFVASSMYCFGRYMHDIGVRGDVEKIDAEGLVTQSEMAAEAEVVG